jgi:hypothetical protein
MSATTRPTHQYQADPTLPADHNGLHVCLCGLPRRHESHRVPEVGPDVRAAEARRQGERNDDE